MQEMIEKLQKRLFFGFSVQAPWPETSPQGKLIQAQDRHITLAFLGNTAVPDLDDFPRPGFLIGPVGVIDKILFLPAKKPRVIAHHVHFLESQDKMTSYHRQIIDWLELHNYSVDPRPYLPHITLARSPFSESEWLSSFEPLPIIITGIHLYESTGNLNYPTVWSLPLTPAFEEFEHTADIAFRLRGTSFDDLYLHGAIAMSFKYPQFIKYFEKHPITSLGEVVQKLNQMISKCDLEIGCPFKAVSYHGKIRDKNGLMHWEMVVDV